MPTMATANWSSTTTAWMSWTGSWLISSEPAAQAAGPATLVHQESERVHAADRVRAWRARGDPEPGVRGGVILFVQQVLDVHHELQVFGRRVRAGQLHKRVARQLEVRHARLAQTLVDIGRADAGAAVRGADLEGLDQE